MHRIAAMPGGWTPDAEGVIVIDQTPAPIIFLTAADTEILCLSKATATLPSLFPNLRVTNLLQLQQQLTIDTYADTVLSHAQIIILRILGGRAYWSYGLEVVKIIANTQGTALIVLPGDDRPDPDLISHSTVPLSIVNQFWRYLTEGGIDNLRNGLLWLSDRLLGTQYQPAAPVTVPKVGISDMAEGRRQKAEARTKNEGRRTKNENLSSLSPSPSPSAPSPRIALLFYRAHYLSGNTAPIDALVIALEKRGLDPLPVYVSSLQDPEVQADLVALLQPKSEKGVDLVLNTTSFAIAKLDDTTPRLDLWRTLDVPVLQVILSGGTASAWDEQPMGLSPRDIAMNVALPEVDGRIITRAVSFKSTVRHSNALETDLVTYEPVSDRIEFVADLAANWVGLRCTPPSQRRVALILANYPNRDGRLANGVGLDTPQSCVEILRSLQQAGYTLDDIPASGDELIQRLTAGVTNDPEPLGNRQVHQTLSLEDYWHYFQTLPEAVQREVSDRWDDPGRGDGGGGEEDKDGGEALKTPHLSSLLPPPSFLFSISGIQLGHIFIGIQPSRGYDADPSLNYHAPDLEPTHAYLAFYRWVTHQFGAQAIIHVGKHGNLEWLPGKSLALSSTCYPEVALGPVPHLYPFIVNDPGEGAQAKRRAQAVILDHLTPPLTRAELYGPLQQLEGLVDEYYEAQSLDPTRLAVISDRLLTLLKDSHLLDEVGGGKAEVGKAEGRRQKADVRAKNEERRTKTVSPSSPSSPSPRVPPSPRPLLHTSSDLPTLLPSLDTYLCELKEAQIRDGLHIFGQCPRGRQLRDLTVAIARHPGSDRLGLTRAIAAAWHLDIDPLTDDPAQPWTGSSKVDASVAEALQTCRNVGDLVEILEAAAAQLVEFLFSDGALAEPNAPYESPPHPLAPSPPHLLSSLLPPPSTLLPDFTWLQTHLLPALHRTPQEITHLLRGLDGRYVPSGPAGAPTRNRPDVLPTGRNFFSVDIRAIPTESAWDVGRRAAETLVECYTQEHGEYPQTLGLSMWGTATMRTGGDDLAEALALLGVQPVWDGPSRRVVDFEILPLSALGRPRVDVTLRISGFFRDAFPNLIDLFDQAVAAVAALAEPPDQNPLAARVQQETAHWLQQGLTEEMAQQRSLCRIFGSKPGAYGAGLQGLIEAQNWEDDQDLARAYINWSSYGYGRGGTAASMPEAFEQRLHQLQVVLHNQDNREHDLLDSDDYYQFQGGMTVAVRSLRGENPTTYFGDHALPEQPRVRSLSAEIAKVYRSRVVNPKWIAGVMRHGYKGAFEMAATVDYLFAYDATSRCVADYMYEGVAQSYLLDPTVQNFVRQANPWALKDMAERLLEAHQRGLWPTASGTLLDQLRQIANEAEGILESKL